MCIAIVTTENRRLHETDIREAARSNADGGGMAYIKDGKVEIEKGFMKADDFIKRYEEVIAAGYNKTPMLIHFRIATTGRVGRDNCHPFPVDRGTGRAAMIHNGWFYTGERNALKSDTRVIAERQRNNFNYPTLSRCVTELGQEVGSNNKLAFLFDDAKYLIINEQQGRWYDDIWYSNSWFYPKGATKKPTPLVPSGPACGVNDI